MNNALTLSVSITILSLGLASCSYHSSGSRPESASGNILKLGVFRKGNFIADEKPLRPETTRDLREIALSLPVWEGGWEKSEEWVCKNSENGMHVDKWTNPADGAQHAVTLTRLNVSPEGRTRIEVNHPTLKIFTPSGGWYYPWIAVLERREGGWIVESANKAEG
jgi:hypothetical protein